MKKVMMMLAALVSGVALFMGVRYVMNHEKSMKNNVKIQAELDTDMDNEENEEVEIQSTKNNSSTAYKDQIQQEKETLNQYHSDQPAMTPIDYTQIGKKLDTLREKLTQLKTKLKEEHEEHKALRNSASREPAIENLEREIKSLITNLQTKVSAMKSEKKTFEQYKTEYEQYKIQTQSLPKETLKETKSVPAPVPG